MNKLGIDVSSIRQRVSTTLGDSIVRPKSARLGHPVTRRIDARVSAGETDTPDMVFVYDVEGEEGDVKLALNAGQFRLRDEDKVYGTHILLKPVGEGFVVDGLNYQRYAHYMDGVAVRPQANITLNQFDLGLLQVTRPASMRAIVSEAVYSLNGDRYVVRDQVTRDFTSLIPAGSGEAVAVLVEINPVTGGLRYTEGDPFDASLSHAEAFRVFYPKRSSDDGLVAVGYLKLINSMTIIQTSVHIYAAQEIITRVDYRDILVADDDVVTCSGEVVTVRLT